MIVCHVWDAEYPWDVRVEKVCHALTDRGHDVHLVARNRDGRVAEEPLVEATVHRLTRLAWLPDRLNSWSMFPAFFNPRWIGLMRRTVRRTGAQLIICRDLPLAPAALGVARAVGIPILLDMAENYPAMLRAVWEAGRQRPMDWLVRSPRAAAAVERWVVQRVDHVLVVVEESRERLLALGVSGDRITVVSNTPSLSRLNLYTESRVPGNSRTLRLVYIGLLEAPRGIGVLLEAVAECRRRGLDAQVDVYGTGREQREFVTRAGRLGVGPPIVTFHGFVPYDRALRELDRFDIGVIPHVADESWNTTIPNKLFDFMAAGLPVISSDAQPAARIVRSTRCGEVFRGSDPVDLVRALERLRDPQHRAALGAAGRRAVAQQYHWELDAQRLIDVAETLGWPAQRAHLGGRGQPSRFHRVVSQ